MKKLKHLLAFLLIVFPCISTAQEASNYSSGRAADPNQTLEAQLSGKWHCVSVSGWKGFYEFGIDGTLRISAKNGEPSIGRWIKKGDSIIGMLGGKLNFTLYLPIKENRLAGSSARKNFLKVSKIQDAAIVKIDTPAQPQVIVDDKNKQVRDGQTLDPVGTWRYSDKVQLEIRPDGTILSNSEPAGKWAQRDNKAEYFMVLNDRSEHIATLDKYKRVLRTASRARGVGKSMERIDNGPTRNPDAPDQTTAWKMECRDLETDIKSMEVKHEAATAEAADLWQKHYAARAAGRISTWNIEAQNAESQARGLERSIEGSRKHLLELKSKLGVK